MKLAFAVHSIGFEGLLNFTAFAKPELYFAAMLITNFSLPEGLSKKILLFHIDLFKFSARIS